jgi:hypothetical protein
MLADPEAYTIGKFKPTFPKRRALRGDEDQQVKEAVQQIAAAA